jgi:hypothetical protein
VSRVGCQPKTTIDQANGIGERSSSGHDEQVPRPCSGCDGSESRIQGAAVPEQAAANLDDDVDGHLHEITRVEGRQRFRVVFVEP